jgi:predicted alpha/beta hydrolase family esterase
MSDNLDTFLILHGWGGNKPTHWQEHLQKTMSDAGARVYYPKMPEPMAPNKAAWLANLDESLAEIVNGERNAPLTVVAHSLGAITWMHPAARLNPAIVVDRVLLVAPPYVIPEIPPTDAPPGVSSFFPPPLSVEGIAAAGRNTVIVASDNDDYATFEQTKAYGDNLKIPVYLLVNAGHISPYWGYGEWPWVAKWCLRTADLPPQPRTED